LDANGLVNHWSDDGRPLLGLMVLVLGKVGTGGIFAATLLVVRAQLLEVTGSGYLSRDVACRVVAGGREKF